MKIRIVMGLSFAYKMRCLKLRKGIIALSISLLLILVSAPPLYLMAQEVFYQETVNNQYKIESIYHPVDMTTEPFNQLQYLQSGTMKPFPEMKRKIYVNGKEISEYSEFMNEVKPSAENQLSCIISFYDTDIHSHSQELKSMILEKKLKFI